MVPAIVPFSIVSPVVSVPLLRNLRFSLLIRKSGRRRWAYSSGEAHTGTRACISCAQCGHNRGAGLEYAGAKAGGKFRCGTGAPMALPAPRQDLVLTKLREPKSRTFLQKAREKNLVSVAG